MKLEIIRSVLVAMIAIAAIAGPLCGYFLSVVNDKIRKRDTLALSQLMPANDPRPTFVLPPDSHPPHVPKRATTIDDSEIAIFLGNFAISTNESEFVVLRLYDQDVLTITKE